MSLFLPPIAFIARRASLSAMRVLICGHGYLGEEIADQARARGWDVDTCSLSGSSGSHACDLGDEESVRHLASLVAMPDAIVHCASSGKGGPPAYQHVYRNGIAHLAHFFPNTLLLFTSSSSVYGQIDGSLVNESSPAEPDRETGKILLDTEQACLATNGIVCRLSGIYGPGRSVFMKKYLSGEAVIEEDGRRFLNQIHRDDAASAILYLLDKSLDRELMTIRGEIFNVTDSQPLSQRETYEGLADIFCQPLPPCGPRDENRKRGWTHKRVDNQKLRATGWEPKYPSFLDAAMEIAPTIQY